MTKTISLILTLLSASGGSTFAQDYSAKPTVCSITLESNEEEKVFERHLGAENFNFVELTSQSDKDKQNGQWFDKACESGVQCDVLIVSGHFGGTFFGKSGLSLSLGELEKHSCSMACPGILSEPKEVFLFGCNTLAGKDQDYRSPEEYLHVLLDDGFSRADAERIVESRYGPYGDENKARMMRVFEGVKHIYGFSSAAPTGEHNRNRLEAYLRSIGDYKTHLNQTAHDLQLNDQWTEALRGTSAAQTSGILSNPRLIGFKERTCSLYNDSSPLKNRLALIRTLASDPDFLMYLPSIENFFKGNPPPYRDAEMQSLFEQIQSNEHSRTQFQGLLGSIRAPLLKIELASFGRTLGWLNEEEIKVITRAVLKPLLRWPITNEAWDILYHIGRDIPEAKGMVTDQIVDPRLYSEAAGIEALTMVGSEDPIVIGNIQKNLGRFLTFPVNAAKEILLCEVDMAFPHIGHAIRATELDKRLYSDPHALKALGCLEVTDPPVVEAVTANFRSRDVELREETAHYFLLARPSSLAAGLAAINAISDPNENVRSYLIEYFQRLMYQKTLPNDERFKLAIVNAMDDLSLHVKNTANDIIFNPREYDFNVPGVRRRLAAFLTSNSDTETKLLAAGLLKRYCSTAPDCRDSFIHDSLVQALIPKEKSNYERVIRFYASLTLLDSGARDPEIYEVAEEIIKDASRKDSELWDYWARAIDYKNQKGDQRLAEIFKRLKPDVDLKPSNTNPTPRDHSGNPIPRQPDTAPSQEAMPPQPLQQMNIFLNPTTP